MIIKRIPLHFLLMTILSFSISDRGVAQDAIQPNTVFFQANQFYKTKRYPQAIEAYEQLVAAGITSGHLFYNLGNAYIKIGQKGKAILNYERALQYLPRDADVKSNLDYVRSLVEDESPKGEENWLLSRIFFLEHYLNLNELTVLVSLLHMGLMGALILSILLKRFRGAPHYTMAAFGALLLFTGVSFSLNLYKTELQHKAVVTSKSIEARFEPSDDATSHFTLHEGVVIEITEHQQEWSKIRRWDGKYGWLENHAFEAFFP